MNCIGAEGAHWVLPREDEDESETIELMILGREDGA